MSQRDLFVDAFDLPASKYEIHEAAPAADASPNAGVVDGENVLARVVGPFFLVDGKSRNGRFYTRQLWETALKRTNDRIGTGQMLGTIGHSQPLDDAALLQGLASHRVARLWIDEKAGVGMGEILVLNTPSGRVLNAYLRGGVQFPVSSRGYGGFRSEKREGAPVIDEDSFELETFDFVRVPGVAIAIPRLVESLDTEAAQLHSSLVSESQPELYNERQTVPTTTLEERVMSNETAATISALARQKAQVEDDLTAAYADNEQLRRKNEALSAELNKANGLNEALEGRATAAQQATAELGKYRALGSVNAIQEVFERFRDLSNRNKQMSGTVNENASLSAELAKYRALGTVDEVAKVMNIAEELLNGADAAVAGASELQESMAELGSPEELARALDLLEFYTAMGTPTELQQAADLLEQYIEMGTLSEVKALVARTEQLAESLIAQQRQAKVEALAAATGAPADVVADLLESFGEEGARSMLARLSGKTIAKPAVAEGRDEADDEEEFDDEEESDDEESGEEGDEFMGESMRMGYKRSRAGSLTAALMEQFSTVREESVELTESRPESTVGRRVGSLFESVAR